MHVERKLIEDIWKKPKCMLSVVPDLSVSFEEEELIASVLKTIKVV